jgi:hypothetical protein
MSAASASAFDRDLAAQQRWLFDRITQVTPDIHLASSVADERRFGPDDLRWVREGRVPAARRIDVYRRGYVERLIECLTDDYPAVAHAIGPDDFRALCLDFIETQPPRSSSLNSYGAPFAAFCATWPAPFAACASELARLEWAIVDAIHAAADLVLDAAALGGIGVEDWARACLVPSPALRVLATAYPVHRHYRAFLAGENPSLPEFEPSMVAVSRRGDDVWRVGVAPRFAPLLRQLVAGLPLASALDAMSPADLGAAGTAELQRVLSEWVACGFFAAITV